MATTLIFYIFDKYWLIENAVKYGIFISVFASQNQLLHITQMCVKILTLK